MGEVIEAVETAGTTVAPRARHSVLRVLLAGALTAAAAAVLGVCITGGAQSAADQSPTPMTTTAP
jgi:hypothetical protein